MVCSVRTGVVYEVVECTDFTPAVTCIGSVILCVSVLVCVVVVVVVVVGYS